MWCETILHSTNGSLTQRNNNLHFILVLENLTKHYTNQNLLLDKWLFLSY